jgi:hypothetical protein
MQMGTVCRGASFLGAWPRCGQAIRRSRGCSDASEGAERKLRGSERGEILRSAWPALVAARIGAQLVFARSSAICWVERFSSEATSLT